MEDKINTLAANALSKISDKSRRRNDSNRSTVRQEDLEALRSTPVIGVQRPIGWQTEPASRASPFGGGIAFGGGDAPSPLYIGNRPRPIGFRAASGDASSEHDQSRHLSEHPTQETKGSGAPEALAESSESLYQGDCRKLSWYPRLFFACLLRLLVFIGKIYQDFYATKHYNLLGLTGHFLIAAATLLLPTIMFTLYRVARYLQLVLPEFEAISAPANNGQQEAQRELAQSQLDGEQGVDSQRKDAAGTTSSPSLGEDEGLVTARQTPDNEEFYELKSDQELAAGRRASKADRLGTSFGVAPPERPVRAKRTPGRPLNGPANVDKMGQLPDKRTTSIALGASEQLLHGVLFIFWNLKRQVDVLSFLVARVCKWRAPMQQELEQLDKLQTDSNGLEWFQDFYAAFLAILTQIYALGLIMAAPPTLAGDDKGAGLVPSAALADKLSTVSLTPADSDVLNRIVSLDAKHLVLVGQLIVSLAVLFSLLMAVRRLDDGPLTLGLSIIGWGSLFAARILIIAFSFLHLGWRLMIGLVALHVLAIAGWIYSIALDSHNDAPSEREHEAMWDQQVEQQLEQQQQQQTSGADQGQPAYPTSRWTLMDHVTLLTHIFCLFALPSLFYWPIMFNLKLHKRPFKYLLILMAQNFLLITALLYHTTQLSQLYSLAAAGALSISGFVFISLYIACKPTLTEYFAHADELLNQAKQAGVYYEYCSRVFKMPDLSKSSFKRLLKQEQFIEVAQIGQET